MKKKSVTRRVWNTFIGEVRATIVGVGKATVLHPTWKESFKILRQSILPALFERFVGLVIVGTLAGLAYLLLQLITVLSAGQVR